MGASDQSGVRSPTGVRGRSTPRRPRRAVVRSLTVSGNGFYRAVGGASIGTSLNGT